MATGSGQPTTSFQVIPDVLPSRSEFKSTQEFDAVEAKERAEAVGAG
jgi:hypothetical protein